MKRLGGMHRRVEGSERDELAVRRGCVAHYSSRFALSGKKLGRAGPLSERAGLKLDSDRGMEAWWAEAPGPSGKTKELR